MNPCILCAIVCTTLVLAATGNDPKLDENKLTQVENKMKGKLNNYGCFCNNAHDNTLHFVEPVDKVDKCCDEHIKCLIQIPGCDYGKAANKTLIQDTRSVCSKTEKDCDKFLCFCHSQAVNCLAETTIDQKYVNYNRKENCKEPANVEL